MLNPDMEMEEWETRNSEFALYESQRELESSRLQVRQASVWEDQSQRESIGFCGELVLRNRLYQEICTRSRPEEIEELRRRDNREDQLSQHRLDNFLCSGKRIRKQAVKLWPKSEEYSTRWISCQMHEILMILTLGAGLDIPTFLNNILSFRVPEEGRGASLECREIHEMIRVFEETFLKTHLLKKIPKSSLTVQRIWRHHQWPEKIGRENVWRKSWLHILWPQYQYLVFRGEQDVKVTRVQIAHPWWLETMPVGLTYKMVWWNIRDIKYLLANSQTLQYSKAGKWTSEQKYARKLRILVSRCSGSKQSK